MPFVAHNVKENVALDDLHSSAHSDCIGDRSVALFRKIYHFLSYVKRFRLVQKVTRAVPFFLGSFLVGCSL